MPAIGASSILGIALEATPGTFVVPTKFVPYESESMKYQQDTQWRRPIRNTPGLIGAVAGNVHTEGEIQLEALHDIVPYFLMASRCTFTKTGATAPYTYVFTPSPTAVPLKTMSIAIKRNNEVFAYSGCVVSSFTISIDNGMLKFQANMVGQDEATTGALTAVWPTSVPYGAGAYSFQIPTATQVFDTDSFELQVEDNADPQYRLKNNGRGAQFVKFGENAVSLKVERDFETRADYDAYKALTAQAITLLAQNPGDTSNSIQCDVPVAIKDSYEVNVGGVADLVRASIQYQGAIDGTGKAYSITVKTSENIT